MPATVTDQIRFRLRAQPDLPGPQERAELRRASGLTQQEVADIIGVTRAAVCQWEAGLRTPRGVLRDRYAEALRALREAA